MHAHVQARELTNEEMEKAYQLAITGTPYTKIASDLGFNNDMAFFTYRQRHPDFDTALRSARHAGNDLMEDEIRSVADIYDNPQTARVKMESLCRILAFRDPTKYGNKVDINLTQTVDIGSSLNRMQQALDATYRDVTQIAAPKESNDSEDLW